MKLRKYRQDLRSKDRDSRRRSHRAESSKPRATELRKEAGGGSKKRTEPFLSDPRSDCVLGRDRTSDLADWFRKSTASVCDSEWVRMSPRGTFHLQAAHPFLVELRICIEQTRFR